MPSYQEELVSAIQKRDPRQPFIDEALRIVGKTRENFGNQFDNPEFAEEFYTASMKLAEKHNPDLNITQPSTDYLATLKSIPSPSTGEEPPETPPEKPQENGPHFFPKIGSLNNLLTTVGDIGIQTATGAIADPIAGILSTAEDLQRLGEKILPESQKKGAFFPFFFVPEKGASFRLGGKQIGSGESDFNSVSAGKTLSQAVDSIVKNPQSGLSQTTRSMAAFLSPFLAIAKPLRAAAGLGNIATGIAAEAITNAAFIDPDEPFFVDLIDEFARGISPENPASIRGTILKYIDGNIEEDQLKKRFAERGIRVAENVPLSLLTEGFFAAVKMLRSGRVTKDYLESLPIEKQKLALPEGQSVEQTLREGKELQPPAGPKPKELPEGTIPPKLPEGESIPKTIREGRLLQQPASRPAALLLPPREKLTEDVLDIVASQGDKLTAETISQAAFDMEMKTGIPRSDYINAANEILELRRAGGEGKIAGQLDKALADTPIDRLFDQPHVNTPQMDAFVKDGTEKLFPILGKQAASKVTKAFVGAMFGALGSEAIPEEVFASSDEVPKENMDSFTKLVGGALIGAGVALGAKSIFKILNNLRKTRGHIPVSKAGKATIEGLPESVVRDVKMPHSIRKSPPGGKFAAFVPAGDEAIQPSGTTLGRMKGFDETIRVAFNMVDDPEDLAALIKQTEQLFPEAETARQGRLNTKLADIDVLAQKIGADPKKIRSLIDEATEPFNFSQKARALTFLADASEHRLITLAQKYKKGLVGIDEVLQQHAITGEIAHGFELGRSDFGRALNMFKQAADGRMDFSVWDDAIGETPIRTSANSADGFVDKILALHEKKKLREFAAATVRPNVKTALTEAYINILLGAPRTASKALVGNISRIALELPIREAGAILNRLEGIEGGPAIGESLVMLRSLRQNVMTAMRLGVNTLRTGETHFMESGTQKIPMHTPQFVKEAFPSILTDLPGVGTALDGLGSVVRAIGGRGLMVGDEMAQFFIENMELEAHAYRAAASKTFQNEAERASFLKEFVLNPPKDVIGEVKRQKRTLTFMNSLFDERGGFRALRKLTGEFNRAVTESPAARIQFPFLRAMTNLMTFGAEMMPGLNVISGSFREELMSSDPIRRATAQGTAVVGLGIASLGMALGAAGIITGPMTTDKDVRELFTHAGLRPNSLHIGDYQIPLDPTEPFGFVLSSFASLGRAMSDDVTPEEMGAVTSLFVSVLDLLRNNTLLRPFSTLIDAIETNQLPDTIKKKGPEEIAGKTVDDLFLRSVLPPRIMQEVARVIEPQKKVYDTYWEQLQAKVGIGEPETDIFGRPRMLGGGVGTTNVDNAVRFIFPISPEKIPQDRLSKELVKKGVVIRDPSPVFTRDGISVPLTKKEQQRLRTLISHLPGEQPLKTTIEELIDTKFWKEATGGRDGVAAAQVKKIVHAYTAVARELLYRENGELRERLRAKGTATGFLEPQQ